MKTNFYRVMVLMLGLSVSFVAYSQNAEDDVEYQKYLKQSREQMVKKQRLMNVQTGIHYGLNISLLSDMYFSKDGGSDCYYDKKPDYFVDFSFPIEIGINAFYGKRFNEYWMVSGIMGIDYKKTIYHIEYSSYDDDGSDVIIGLPIIGEVKYYFGLSRLTPYVHASAGTYISRCIGYVYNLGVGMDYNYKGSNTVFVSLGIGQKTLPGRVVEKRQPTDKFHSVGTPPAYLTLKIGYYLK